MHQIDFEQLSPLRTDDPPSASLLSTNVVYIRHLLSSGQGSTADSTARMHHLRHVLRLASEG